MKFEVVIVGAGVIGLAIARSLSKNYKILIIEKESTFGTETSSRNSSVIHAGIYYPHLSLKSKFCKNGNEALYKYLKEKRIQFNKCGKLIVSSNCDEDLKLKEIKKKAILNKINLKYLNKEETKRIEPQLNCFSSLHSPSTGVLDTHDLMINFVADIEKNHGITLFNNKVSEIIPKKDCIHFKLENENEEFKTKILVNAAGLDSYNLAMKIIGLKRKFIPKMYYLKGNYFKLVGSNPFKKLIYPLPKKNSLGIHSTLNLNNETIFGPDEEKVKCVNYNVNENKAKKFKSEIYTYWPLIKNKRLLPDYAGIRGVCRNEDFIIQTKREHQINGLINLFNINSPGLTCSLEIAKYINCCIKEKEIYN